MGNHNYSYRSAGGLGRWASLACLLLGFVFLLAEAAFFYDWVVLGDVQEHRFASAQEMMNAIHSAAFYAQTTSYSSMALLFLTYLLFFIWVYRTSANAHAMGADLSYGAGFSVGIFFVPGLNFILPPMMMSELIRATINAPSWRNQTTSAIVPLWWTLQLIVSVGGIALNIGVPSHGASISEFRNYFLWTLSFLALEILHFLVMGLLVIKVSANQRRQRERIEVDRVAASFS